jgi:hypothetical protein
MKDLALSFGVLLAQLQRVIGPAIPNSTILLL